MIFPLLIKWLFLTVGTFVMTRLIFGILLRPSLDFPQPSLKPNYTNGDYNSYWATVYQANAALQKVSYQAFIEDPQHHLHKRVLSLPLIDTEPLPLLPAQELAALESILPPVDPGALEQARFFLSKDSFKHLLTTVRNDGKTRFQF